MKTYSSFLIRCWLICEPPLEERSIIEVEHIQTGVHTRAASLIEVEEWMLESCRSTRSDTKAARAAGREPGGSEEPQESGCSQ